MFAPAAVSKEEEIREAIDRVREIAGPDVVRIRNRKRLERRVGDLFSDRRDR